MRFDWSKLGPPSMPEAWDYPTRFDVLVEYDGPQLALVEHSMGRSLALFADFLPDRVRWIFSATSILELEALASGGVAMRGVFSRKDNLRIVDLGARNKPLAVWSVEPGDIPQKILPVRGAPLPAFAREPLLKKLKVRTSFNPAERRIRFAGGPVHEHTIEFAALARLSQWIQNLWTAIGEALGIHEIRERDGMPSTALMAAANGPGSFSIDVRAANEKVFDLVAQRYDTLVGLAFDDLEKLSAELSQHPELAKTFRSYLGVLEELRAEAFVETPGARIYIGCQGVNGAREVLKPSKRASTPRNDNETPETSTDLVIRGYFDVFGVAPPSFKFVDIDTGDLVQGSVAQSLVDRISGRKEQEAAVGRMTRYRITVERGPDDDVLKGFEALGQGNFPFD